MQPTYFRADKNGKNSFPVEVYYFFLSFSGGILQLQLRKWILSSRSHALPTRSFEVDWDAWILILLKYVASFWLSLQLVFRIWCELEWAGFFSNGFLLSWGFNHFSLKKLRRRFFDFQIPSTLIWRHHLLSEAIRIMRSVEIALCFFVL